MWTNKCVEKQICPFQNGIHLTRDTREMADKNIVITVSLNNALLKNEKKDKRYYSMIFQFLIHQQL